MNRTAIYWSSDQEGVIRRTDLDGVNGPEVVVSDAETPCGIALDQEHIYWADSDPGTIGRADLDGSEAPPNFIVGGEFTSTVAIDGGHLYWVNAGWGYSSIGEADLNGTNVNQRALAGLRYPFALAVDSLHIEPNEPAVAPSAPAGTFRLGEVKHRRTGVAFLAVDVFGSGDLNAAAPGVKASVMPFDVATKATHRGGG